MFAEPPAAPKGMQITEITRNSVTLSWLPPEIDGGAAISAYIIERRELTARDWHRVARIKPHNLSYTITGLIEGVDYVFRVLAENVEGISEALVIDQHVRPIREESKCVLSTFTNWTYWPWGDLCLPRPDCIN